MLVVGASLRASAKRMLSLRRGRIAMGIRKKSFPIMRHKTVTATKRLPLWHLDDEMYLNRQLAPHQNQRWLDLRRTQSRMREMAYEQQKRDMKEMERELTGFRLEPKYKVSELRQGQWLDGRVSGYSEHGVWVDMGVYNEAGEWVDGWCQLGQIREDGEYVPVEKIANHVHLGEIVRVRIRSVVPGACQILLSMRTVEDLPPLFMGKPRLYAFEDLEVGMKVTGIVRRVWTRHAIVDFGGDRLARIHVSDHRRRVDRKGFEKDRRTHKYAYTAFAKGAQMDFYVKTLNMIRDGSVHLMCRLPRGKVLKNSTELPVDPMQRREGGMPESFSRIPGKEERLTHGQKLERERSFEEKKPYEPYVPFVKEWLDTAMEPDEEQDSWVARTESELFEELQAEGEADSWGNDEEEGEDDFADEEEDYDEDFADDEFAEDDFVDGEFNTQAAAQGFSDTEFSASELDGWDFDDANINELEDDDEEGKKLTEMQVEALFDGDDDYLERRAPKTIMEKFEDKAKEARRRKYGEGLPGSERN